MAARRRLRARQLPGEHLHHAGPATAGVWGTYWNPGSIARSAPGSATQSCTPSSNPLLRSGVSSVCAIPRPAVITETPPGRATAS